ncbi:MAG: radical SAM protein [Bacteroidota bacterium]
MDKNKNKKKRVCVIDPPSQCPLRCMDASKLRNYFTVNNMNVTDHIDDADIILYVTCSVSPNDVENTLKDIEAYNKYKAELFVMGCMPGSNLKELRTGFDGPAISTKNISDIDTYFPEFNIKYNQTPEPHTYHYADMDKTIFFTKHDYYSLPTLLLKYGLSQTFFRKYYRLKEYKKFLRNNNGSRVEDACFILTSRGCTNNCSYCNIRRAVGKIKSKSIDALVNEYAEMLNQGYRIFHFLADDLGSYGLDMHSSLNELLDALSEIDEKYHVKWSLHGMNPAWIVKNQSFLRPYFEAKKVWDITIAMESGSDRIIRLMNRHYKAKDVEAALRLFRKLNPGLRIDALFFVGFPTETEEDFMATFKFVKNNKFDKARVTYYYEFDYLPAAKLYPKVSAEEMKNRIERIDKLLNK